MRVFRWIALAAVPSVLLVAASGERPAKRELVPEIAPKQRQAGSPAPKKASAEPKFVALQTPEDAVGAALADLATVHPSHRPLVRYVWLRHGGELEVKTGALALYYANRAPFFVRPMIVGDGHLLRVYLPSYAARDKERDLADWLKSWEEFAFDPEFALNITRDVVRLLDLPEERVPRVKVRRRVTRRVPAEQAWRTEVGAVVEVRSLPFRVPDDSGRVWNALPEGLGKYRVDLRFRDGPAPVDVVEFVDEFVSIRDADDANVVRGNRHDIDPDRFAELQQLTVSSAPVVSLDYFVSRILSTVKTSDAKDVDTKVFETIYGGLYYEFRGIKRAKKEDKFSDEDLFFQDIVGIGNIKGGVDAAKLFDGLRSDQRTAIARSRVTGKKRRADLFNTPQNREGSGWGSITHDIRDEDVDIGADPIANLLVQRDFAREAIFPGATGAPVFALFNAKGALQDEVPFNVALDSTIPAPHSQRLQAAIGCIRCHGTDDGWKPIGNDVKKLLGAYRVDLFGDLSQLDRTVPDTLERIAGLYTGDFRDQLAQAQNVYAKSLLKAVGPWRDSPDQTDAVLRASKALGEVYGRHNYDLVDPQRALEELGIEVQREFALETFRAILPPDGRARIGGIVPEDPRIALLFADIPIGRTDWDSAKPFAAERSKKNRDLLLKGAKK